MEWARGRIGHARGHEHGHGIGMGQERMGIGKAWVQHGHGERLGMA